LNITAAYKNYYKYCLNIAKKYLSNEDAEDISHDVFIKLSEIDSKDISNLKNLLHTYTKNACIDYIRKNKNYNIFYDNLDFYHCCFSDNLSEIDKINVLKVIGGETSEIYLYLSGYSVNEISKMKDKEEYNVRKEIKQQREKVERLGSRKIRHYR